MTPGLNPPHGVENVHTLCVSKLESNDQRTDISVKRLETLCIKRYIKAEYYYYYHYYY